jgi:hypothetical protein
VWLVCVHLNFLNQWTYFHENFYEHTFLFPATSDNNMVDEWTCGRCTTSATSFQAFKLCMIIYRENIRNICKVVFFRMWNNKLVVMQSCSVVFRNSWTIGDRCVKFYVDRCNKFIDVCMHVCMYVMYRYSPYSILDLDVILWLIFCCIFVWVKYKRHVLN